MGTVGGMSSTYAQRKALGEYGERLAARHLQGQGLAVLDRNWRCRDGEIDVVAADGHTLVVCEVKTRSSTRYGTPMEAITAEKAARLHRLGRSWARAQSRWYDEIRVDVVTVLVGRGSPTLDHVTGVV